MPRTLDQGFRDFQGRLTPSDHETEAAKTHRASIKQCIESNFELLRFWRTGSFGNGTSISGYSDVDYMANIPSTNLDENSSTTLAKIRAALDARFPKTGVRTSCPAVVIPFGTDAKETTEVTPSRSVGNANGIPIYEIPDCGGDWTKASPDAHNAYVRVLDQRLSRKLKPLIRFVKAWKYFQNVPISSFYLELRVAKYASQESTIDYSIDLRSVFKLLHDKNLAQIQDPMGISGLISPCRSGAQLLDAKSKLSTALSRATKAREAESRGDIKDAFHWWDLLFAHRFPSYYS